jgi:hypothetical protein
MGMLEMKSNYKIRIKVAEMEFMRQMSEYT